MCILYLDKQVFFLKIIEYVNWIKELKKVCLIVVGYLCKIYVNYFFYGQVLCEDFQEN